MMRKCCMCGCSDEGSECLDQKYDCDDFSTAYYCEDHARMFLSHYSGRYSKCKKGV